jgi:biopolymer transport protein ExbD
MELVLRSSKPVTLFSNVDTTAFTSILVVLIITVLVFAGMSYNPHHGVSVDLPNVSHSVAMRGALRDDAMKITILRDGKVYFGADRIWSSDLARRISERLKDRAVERKIYISADMRARWSDVENVLDGVRSAGILEVAFLANQRRSPSLTR